MKDMKANWERHAHRAKKLQKYIVENFTEDKQHQIFVDSILELVKAPAIEELLEFD